MKRDLKSIKDFSVDEIYEIFELSADLKSRLKKGDMPKLLNDKVLAMVFEKPSLRTRCTFEIGMFQLGGHAIHLQPSNIGLGQRESIHDVAKNFERWVDLIMARTFSHNTIEELAKHASVPVINALSDLTHPCQAMTDIFTLKEHFGNVKGLTLSYIGDGNNVCNSLMLGCSLLGININISTPKGYEPQKEIVKISTIYAKKSGGSIMITDDPVRAVKEINAIYTDVWASMGQESEAEERKKIFADYQLNSNLLSYAPEDTLIMHCLPAHRGLEITDDVIDSQNSIVFDQAENRLHVQKAIMVFLHRESNK